jgi:UDP-glucose 4-epimerase
MKVLITGGAGYVGAHVALAFRDAGHKVSILDRIPINPKTIEEIEFLCVDLLDNTRLKHILKARDFDFVIHCAALTSLPLSLSDPIGFFSNNVAGTLNLLQALNLSTLKVFVFSSTAAVYAPTPRGDVDEASTTAPLTPYGESKLQCENILRYVSSTFGLKVVCLRYFNVAGADKALRAGPTIRQIGALFPSLATAALSGEPFTIYGLSHATPDGTPVRDFIHVSDLAEAHLKIAHNSSDKFFDIFNVGYGRGCSVAEAFHKAALILPKQVACRIGARRPGDLSKVVARVDKLAGAIGELSPNCKVSEMLISTFRWLEMHGVAKINGWAE